MKLSALVSAGLPASVLVAALAASPAARAETTLCTEITSLPTVINTQGVYCMKKHLSTSMASGAAISVNVNNVTIDCNEYKIGNLSNGPATQAVGVLSANHLNVNVRNCGVRGFRTGVSLTGGLYRVEHNSLDQNWQTGLWVGGDGSVVRGNDVIETGGSTVAGVTEFAAIRVDGDVDITDNNVTDVAATGGSGGHAIGIYGQGNDAGNVRGNRIRNLVADGVAGRRRGIWNEGSNHITVEDNTVIMSGSTLVMGEAAIRCGDSLVLLNGTSRDNTVLGVGVGGTVFALLNCTAIAGDYVSPL